MTPLDMRTRASFAPQHEPFCQAEERGFIVSVALIHSGLDAFQDSDSLLLLFGGYFRGHPWHADGTWRFLNEQGAHPVNASFRHLPTSFEKVDEIYQFPAFFDRSTCTVLLSMDLSDPVTNQAEEWWAHRFGPSSTRPDRDYAVSWVKAYNEALAAALRGHAVFADVNARFAHADGTIASELFRDGRHFCRHDGHACAALHAA